MDEPKIVLLDADGVILEEKGYFSTLYSQEYGVPMDALTPFFRTVFRGCQKGELDLKEQLALVLDAWRWQGTVDELVAYWLTSCTLLDEGVIQVIQELRGKGLRCFLASNQERYRGEYLKQTLGLDQSLDGCFFSYELGYQKSEKEFFQSVLEKLGGPGEEVLFLDNDASNVLAAQSVGIRAQVFEGVDDLRGLL